jgi:hypothetical protein
VAFARHLPTRAAIGRCDAVGMNPLAWFALLLIAAWFILRLAVAVTSGLLHLLWIAALVMLALSLLTKLRKR